MKQLPDILTSANFWASIATIWAASGAWGAYVAAELASRQRTYEGILNLIDGLEAELALVSLWASGDEDSKGYLPKSRAELAQEHPDWFNPKRGIFRFSTPTLSNLTNSPYAKSLTPIVRPFVMLNYSIRRLFDSIDRHQAFVYADVAKYQTVVMKLTLNPPNIGSTATPSSPYPSQIGLTTEERDYVNEIYLMNEGIHQQLIGGADSSDEICLYKAFRSARQALQDFKNGLKREALPGWFPLFHIVAGALFWVGFWQLMRWFEIW
jgi:hypothetical protein